MKDMIINLMIQMMPYMKPLAWAGVALAGLGVLSLLLKIVGAWRIGNPGLRFSGTLMVVIGLFFIAAYGIGIALGMSPKLNLADPTKFEFNLKPFWQVGLVFFVPGAVFCGLGRSSRG